MTSDPGRDDLKRRIFEYLKVNPSSQYQSLRQFGLERAIGRSLTYDEDRTVLEIIHELFSSNILMPGVDAPNSGWPWFRLTRHGEAVLAAAGPPVYDYEGYLDDLRSRTQLDKIVETFLAEALQAYQRNLYLASVAMLGCASERAIWLLMNAFIDSVDDPKNQAGLRGSISGRDISVAYKRFRGSFDSVRTQLPASLHSDFDVHIDAVFQFTRLQRNAVLHPSTLPSVTPAVAHASLQQFSYYLPTVGRVIDHLANHPITL